MSEESGFRYTRKIDLVKDILGADTTRDAIKVILKYQDVSPLDVDVGEIADALDITDEAGRELGKVYGSNAEPIPQESVSPFEPQVSVNQDNVGLAKDSSVSSIQPRNIRSWGGTEVTGSDITSNITNLDIAISVLRDALKTYDNEFTVNQDVNASAFTSSETEITRCDTIGYGLSGAGAFTLSVKFTDGSGTVLYSEDYSSSDGSKITGELTTVTKNVIVEVTDDSGSGNTVTGGVYAR